MAAGPARVRLLGLPVFLRSMAQAARDITRQPVTWTEVAGDVATGVRRTAPRRTGALARSAVPAGRDDGATVLLPLRYSVAVEYGTPRRGIPGAHFLARAEASAQRSIYRRLDAMIQRVADRVRGVGGA